MYSGIANSIELTGAQTTEFTISGASTTAILLSGAATTGISITGVMGADACIVIDIAGSDYYIPIFAVSLS